MSKSSSQTGLRRQGKGGSENGESAAIWRPHRGGPAESGIPAGARRPHPIRFNRLGELPEEGGRRAGVGRGGISLKRDGDGDKIS